MEGVSASDELTSEQGEQSSELYQSLTEMFDFLTCVMSKNGKFQLRHALLQAFIKQEQLNGIVMDPLAADGKARGYITYHASTLKANNIGMEKFGRHESYAMNYPELAGLFLQLFDWFRNLYLVISEHKSSMFSEQLLHSLKAHFLNIRCQLAPSVVMCILHVPLDTATQMMPQHLEDCASPAKKARCMFKRGDRRCKATVILDADFEKATCKVYCKHHSQTNHV